MPYRSAMGERLERFRYIGRATFPRHQRGLDVLGIVSLVVLVGVTLTGIWQFFAHSPDPDWLERYATKGTGGNIGTGPTTVAAEIHDAFATAAGLVALVGSAWFAYRIAHRVPAFAIVAIGCTFFGALAGGLVTYGVVKVTGRPLEESGSGYLQVFTRDVEFAVTESGEVGPTAFRLLVLSHIATVPILIGFGWWSIRRAIDRRYEELQNQPKRTWFT